jgi:hypothetical protein
MGPTVTLETRVELGGPPPPSVELHHGGIAAHELGQPTLVSGVSRSSKVGDPPADGKLARVAHCASAITRLVSSANAKWNASENVGNGWIVSFSTTSGTRARIATVACCIHSPASGPSP